MFHCDQCLIFFDKKVSSCPKCYSLRVGEIYVDNPKFLYGLYKPKETTIERNYRIVKKCKYIHLMEM